ncbi:MAG: hypothetical protein JWQ49_1558 [Edaphobacter sp.]|nr:hypothetical protein [Edaphobacter sp.]
MNPQNNKSPLPAPSLAASLIPGVPATAKGSAASVTSDCLYQFAALTAGAFLLASLI